MKKRDLILVRISFFPIHGEKSAMTGGEYHDD
jgi:hypothetical protein